MLLTAKHDVWRFVFFAFEANAVSALPNLNFTQRFASGKRLLA
jgi:hypothetical protein